MVSADGLCFLVPRLAALALGDHKESFAKVAARSSHHPCDSCKGRSCQMERKGLFFYSPMFPPPLPPRFCFFRFTPSFSLFLHLSHSHPLTLISSQLSTFTLPLNSRLYLLHLYLHRLASSFQFSHLLSLFSLSYPPPTACARTTREPSFRCKRHLKDLTGTKDMAGCMCVCPCLFNRCRGSTT